MRLDDIAELHAIANRFEADRAIFARALTLLYRLTGSCPWELDAGGMPTFWSAMRFAQRLCSEAEGIFS